MSVHKPNFVVVTESLPKNSPYPKAYFQQVEGYTSLVNTKYKHEFFVYVHLLLKHTEVNDPLALSINRCLVIDVKIPSSTNSIRITAVYRSPIVNELSPNNNANLLQYLQNVSTISAGVLVVGDFNLPSIDQKNQITSLSEQSFEHHFLQNLQNMYLCKHIQEPTQFWDDLTPSVFDLVITKSPDNVRNIEILPPLGKSDHTIVKLLLKCSGDDSTPQKQILKYNYTKDEYESF
ncbi:hypothetical protein QYM36_012662 [Artemia franciscana]|uniref:Endonuclease/exonuclease/phosphatase domain-containing protein n=1 Tax=Artemia franciscana TaxID=6661 RepID=A0AA88HVF6_ARTSF|nr:hypothetical protein QYM36_012662 [Artemia franciscana]